MFLELIQSQENLRKKNLEKNLKTGIQFINVMMWKN